MAYIGPETVGGRTAWKFGRDDGGTALIDDPVTAMGMGAPVFAAQAPPALAAPEPLPDMRLANNEAMGEFALADMGAAEKPAFDAATNVPAEQVHLPKPGDAGVTLQPKQEMAQGSELSPGAEYTRGQAEQIAGNLLPVGMRYGGGRAGRDATWMATQRRGSSMTGDPKQDRDLVQGYEDKTEDVYAQREEAVKQNAAAQLEMTAERLKTAALDVADKEIKSVELSELAKRREDAMKVRLSSVDEAQREAENLKTNPNRVWDDANAGQKIALTLGLALGAFGSGVSGGPNQAMQLLNDYISRDTQKQKDKIAQKKDAAAGEQARFFEWMKTNNPELATLRAEAAKLGAAESTARAMALQDDYMTIRGGLNELLPQIQAEKNDKLMQIQALNEKELAEQYLPEIKAVSGGLYRAPLTAEEASKELKARESIGNALDSGGSGMLSQDPTAVFDPASGRLIGKSDEKTAPKMREYAANARSTMNAIATMKDIATKYSSLSPQERAAAEAQALILGQKVWSGTLGRKDAPSGAEAEAIQNVVRNPLTFFSNTNSSMKSLETIENGTKNDWRNQWKANGLDPGKIDFNVLPETQVD